MGCLERARSGGLKILCIDSLVFFFSVLSMGRRHLQGRQEDGIAALHGV